MNLLSFLRKYGDTEEPMFRHMPVEKPPPDEGDAGDKAANVPEDLDRVWNKWLQSQV